MKAKTSKRFLAYLIDIILIGIMLTMISDVLVDKNEMAQLNNQLNEVNEKKLNEEIKLNEVFKEYAIITKQIDLENVMLNTVTIVIILIYFVFVPYYNDGQTLGLKLLNIRIVTRDGSKLTISKLMLRNFIINGLAYMTIGLTFLYLFSSLIYFILVSILGFIQLGLVIMSIFMILYRRDKRGLQDILSETKIIENK